MTKEQRAFLVSIGIDPDEDIVKLIEDVEDYLILHCFDEDYEPNEAGRMCENILDDMLDEKKWEAGRLRTKGK